MLSVLIALPLLGAIVMGIIPTTKGSRSRLVASLFSGLSLAWAVLLGSRFLDHSAVQLQEYLPWLDTIGLSYRLSMDGLSYSLVILNTLLTTIAIYSSPETVTRPRLYYSLLLLINGAVSGAFLANNFLLFFLFYEVELIPLYLLIAVWGGARRGYAATKFLVYTAISGVLILAACFGTAWLSGAFTFDYSDLITHTLPLAQQAILLLLVLIGFGIKIPLVPFHTWLPDAHVEASTPISVLLAGVLLKLGTYGLVRFGLGLFPEAWQFLAPWLAGWAVASVLYGSLTAIAQTDMKKMVAYSSIGHMGYILLATAAATPLSLVGAVMQMVSHGIISAMLFLLVGVVYAKTGTRDLNSLRGLLNPERGLPLIGSLMVLGVMASAGIPGMIGFIAEFIIFRGSFPIFPVQTLLCMVGTMLTAVYFLLLMNRAFFGRLSENAQNLPPVSWHDRIPAFVLAALIVILGIKPAWLTRWSESAMATLSLHSPVVMSATIVSHDFIGSIGE